MVFIIYIYYYEYYKYIVIIDFFSTLLLLYFLLHKKTPYKYGKIIRYASKRYSGTLFKKHENRIEINSKFVS